MSEAIRKQYCVGGVWKDSKTEKWMPVTDSSTGEVIAEVPSCTQDEVLEAIDAADKAFKEWSQVSVSKRTQMMFKWRNILVEHLDELTYLCAKELGKNLSEARGDVLKAIEPTELACATPFVSQGSAIFTQSGYYARQFEMLTDGGMVGINVGIPVPSAYFPFSGNKDSFFGDQHVLGLDGVRFYTRAKTVTKHWYDEHSRKKTVDTWEGTVERN